jgi:DinB superfamily
MTTVVSQQSQTRTRAASQRAQALADRLEQGARALVDFASGLTDAQWQARIPHDGRKIGVIVHHVANMYPLEMQVAQLVAGATPVVGLTMANVDEINAGHAKEQDGVTKEAALQFVQRNSATAAAAIRALTDEELDRAVPNSFYGDAPLTCQFWLEDHPVRHSYHHLAKIKAALNA